MEPKKETESTESVNEDRRDAMQKLGRFVVYAAPFTALALTKKADASTGHGPGKHPAG
jgi:hypothetical protein